MATVPTALAGRHSADRDAVSLVDDSALSRLSQRDWSPLGALDAVRAIRDGDAWCEEPADRNYNRLVKLAPGSSADRLKRADHLYDLILVLGHNDRPRVRGLGSAIFMHLPREGYAPTAGCIALSMRDLQTLLAALGSKSHIRLMP